MTRNLCKVFMMVAMSEREIVTLSAVTLHPAKGIPRLPTGMSFAFSPACYPEPFFAALRLLTNSLPWG